MWNSYQLPAFGVGAGVGGGVGVGGVVGVGGGSVVVVVVVVVDVVDDVEGGDGSVVDVDLVLNVQLNIK